MDHDYARQIFVEHSPVPERMNECNVLFVSSGNTAGGISPIVAAQAASLQAAGASIRFLTVQRKGWRGYTIAARDVRRRLSEHAFDLVHAHYGLSGMAAWMGNRTARLPLVVSFMGDDLLGSKTTSGETTGYSRAAARLNAAMANRCYDYVIFKSEEMRRRVQTPRCAVVPNGVDLDRFVGECKREARERLSMNPRENVVLFASDPSRPEKNFALARAAADRLRETMDLRLEAVHGRKQTELITWLNAADVVALTSYHEGSPNIIKEAMACNSPIVSTPVGDVEWVLGDTPGCYIASYEPDDFARKLASALQFASEQGRTNGRERVLELGLDAETVAKRIVEIYREVLR